MEIKEPERLKYWLKKVLNPSCDAEPLADFIIMSLKQNWPVDKLKKFLLSTITEFWKIEIEGFVTILVESLQSGCYLNNEPADLKRDTVITPSGVKSGSGKKSHVKSVRGDKKHRSRSHKSARKRSRRTKNVKLSRSKRHRRDESSSSEAEERKDYRKYRHRIRSRSIRRSEVSKTSKHGSLKNRCPATAGKPVERAEKDEFIEKSEIVKKMTLEQCIDFDKIGYRVNGHSWVDDHSTKYPIRSATVNDGVLSFQDARGSFSNPLQAPTFPVVSVVQNVPVSDPVQPFPNNENKKIYHPSVEGTHVVQSSGREHIPSKDKHPLISVPPTGEIQNHTKRKNYENESNDFIYNKKLKLDYRHLGPKVSLNKAQSKIVPKNLNNMIGLNNGFMQFGNRTYIPTIGKNKKATITCLSKNKAHRAYQYKKTVFFGSQPILENRFSDNTTTETKLVEDENPHKIITASHKPKMLSSYIRNTGRNRLTNEKEFEVIEKLLIKKQKETKKLAQDFSATITRRKQELLDKQLEQLNKLLELASNVNDEQKKVLMATINRLQNIVENTQADLASAVKKLVTSTSKP